MKISVSGNVINEMDKIIKQDNVTNDMNVTLSDMSKIKSSGIYLDTNYDTLAEIADFVADNMADNIVVDAKSTVLSDIETRITKLEDRLKILDYKNNNDDMASIVAERQFVWIGENTVKTFLKEHFHKELTKETDEFFHKICFIANTGLIYTHGQFFGNGATVDSYIEDIIASGDYNTTMTHYDDSGFYKL